MKYHQTNMNVLTFILLGSFLFSQSATSAQQKIVTAAQVNGTWESKFGTFKILALGKQKLKVEFSGIYPYKLADGSPTANTGEGRGSAIIEGDRASFKPEGAEDECLISMRFAGGRLEVKQNGTCGFGHNVTAAGKYRRVSARRPKFEDN
jgi:hypothetical protein